MTDMNHWIRSQIGRKTRSITTDGTLTNDEMNRWLRGEAPEPTEEQPDAPPIVPAGVRGDDQQHAPPVNVNDLLRAVRAEAKRNREQAIAEAYADRVGHHPPHPAA